MRNCYDPVKAAAALAKKDKVLARLIRKAGPCTIASRNEAEALLDPFQALLRSIVYQQLSGKAAATIHGRVLALYGSGPVMPQQVLDTDDETLRGAGLSRAKIAAVKDLAAKTLAGVVPQRAALEAMADEEIIATLVQVRGIGRWTVEMLLMFYLARADVLPVNDLGVRKGYMLAYGTDSLPAPEDLLDFGENWRPYRSVASWYMWRAVDLLGGK